jgi:hypothetical protein
MAKMAASTVSEDIDDEKIIEKPFAVTDLYEIHCIIRETDTLNEVVQKVVGRESRVCRWGSCQYAEIQDIFDFLMYMYQNDSICKEDPMTWVLQFTRRTIKLENKSENPLLSIRINVIASACNMCETEEELAELLACIMKIQTVDDFFEFLRDHGYVLWEAITLVFDSLYQTNSLVNIYNDIKYAIMCWILVIKGHVKDEESFGWFDT